ncbi:MULTISPECIES: DUF3307 domain-containing protein [Streptomyces]|nr:MULTISPECIES: DUF3307 domain-containing protein [Streptomyces]KOG67396.1 hypothetical protein ADK78_40755 [Kitasatospora aureofaciens]KEF08190.1 hypothetical protein DF17_07835 [Streptomyces rimosus]KOT45682.1 hypothetical protein ADK42_02675 [Streptomyces rimosus subsp. rimosus]KOT46958.1 hypothetical protein ADK84_02240 [Streptomyces sp. NRRL WC-3701]KOT67119.1 hypothetical protein ADK44_04505 [Streptomyces rimosus subsp. rimosus]
MAAAEFAAAYIALFTAHHAADYLAQGDRMSARKAGWTEQGPDGKSVRHTGWGANQLHAATHSVAELLALGLLAAVVHLPLPVWGVTGAVLWIHLTHSLIDRRWPVRAWMCHTGSAGFVQRGGMPLVDQSMHLVFGLFPAALLIAGGAS